MHKIDHVSVKTFWNVSKVKLIDYFQLFQVFSALRIKINLLIID